MGLRGVAWYHLLNDFIQIYQTVKKLLGWDEQTQTYIHTYRHLDKHANR
jgi:hypothetical protein